ncbi:MAG: N(4)-(beta-N-acetylglucosaminyl)-L-asparaginase [Deinococcales bacterium]
MIIISSANGRTALKEAMNILKQGASALDAVEAATRLVELDPLEHTVGYGGYPNILGEVELDASIMDGSSLESGAVGAVKGYLHVISLARKVMEHLPHVLLVGEGAERFAAEMGFQQENLLSEAAEKVWRKRLEQDMPDELIARLKERTDLKEWVRLATDPERVKGTVNFIARDSKGNIASAVSTSGWAWKYPGRLGDSPIIGAGNYADNRYGAAACTGMGEMAIRGATAHTVVSYMKQGLSVDAALIRGMEDLNDLGGRFISEMNIIALNKDGNPSAASSAKGKTYALMRSDMDEPVELERLFVEIPKRWA